MRRALSFAVVILVLVGFVRRAAAGAQPDEVLVVVNDSSPVSQAIGAYYAQLRGIPPVNVFHLPAGTTTAETISRATFNSQVRDPLATYLSVTQPQLQDRIQYIVLTKYVPLRVSGTNNASVDSELTLLFSSVLGDAGQANWFANPYFDKKQSFSTFTSTTLRYLVCRLDGWDEPLDAATGIPADVKALIDRAQSPATAGAFLLDQDPSKTGGYASGNQWMDQAAPLLGALGQSVQLDPSNTFVSGAANLLGYASWGSNDSFNPGAPYYGPIPAGTGPLYPGVFLPGSLVTDYVSTNGRTFLKANQSYGQSLIADLIHLGASGASGYVDEPFLQACARPHVLFPRFLNGFDAAEAYYMATPYLSWQNVVVVDPLMTSGIVAQFPPTITAIFPQRGPAGGGTEVYVSGTELGAPGDAVAVSFGGVAGTNPYFWLQNVARVMTPAHAPGPADVEVTVAGGSVTVEDGFLYLPALLLSGSTAIGQPATLAIEGSTGESFVLFLGAATASLPVPGYGTLLLDPNAWFQAVLAAPFVVPQPGAALDFVIPQDPALVGTTAHFQALVGKLAEPGVPGRLSNLVSLTVTP